MGLRCIENTIENKKKILVDSLFSRFREELGAKSQEDIKDISTCIGLFYEKMISPDFEWVVQTNNSKYVNNFSVVHDFMTRIEKTLKNSVVTINYGVPELKSAKEIMEKYILSIKN